MKFEDERKEKETIDLTEFQTGDIAVVHIGQGYDDHYLVIKQQKSEDVGDPNAWGRQYIDYYLLDLKDMHIASSLHDTGMGEDNLSGLFARFDPRNITRIKGKFVKVVVSDESND